MAKLDMPMRRELLDLFVKSAGDYLDGWFESAPIKAAYGFDGIVGNYASPYSAGSAYVLLHHVFGEVNGKKGAWGHAHRRHGRDHPGHGEVRRRRAASRSELSTPVREVIVEGGRAVGVVTESGEAIARALRRLEPQPEAALRQADRRRALLDRNFRERIGHWRCGSGTFRMNVALAELPDFTALPGRAWPTITPPASSWRRASPTWTRPISMRRRGGWSQRPIVEMLIPSTLDDSLAPPGRHVASLFCQHVAPALPDGASWDDHRERSRT